MHETQGASGPERTRIGELIANLDSEVEDVRKFAVLWLSQIGDVEVAPHLERMMGDPSESVRHFARWALHDFLRRTSRPNPAEGDPAELLSSEDPEDRVRAGLLCYGNADPGLMAEVSARLALEENPRVIATLVKALGLSGDSSWVPQLLPYLMHPDSRIRANTVEALEPHQQLDVLEHVSLLVDDPDNRVRVNVLAFLARHDEQRVRESVEEMLNSPLLWERHSALHIMKRLGSDWCLEKLTELAESPLPTDLKALVCEALGFVNRSRQALQETQVEPDGGTTAGEGSPGLESPVAEPQEGADGERAGMATRYTELTVGLGAILDTNDWVRALVSPDFKIRIHALQNSVLFPRSDVLGALRRRLVEESHVYVQATLVKVMGGVGEAGDTPRLLPFLRSEDSRVRANTIEGLEKLGGGAACDAVRPLLKDDNARVRSTAARFVHNHDRAQALDTLEQMVLSGDTAAVRSALHMLGSLAPTEMLQIFAAGLGHGSQDAQIAMLQVLEASEHSSPLAADLLRRFRDGSLVGVATATLDELLEKMNSPSPEIRCVCLKQLAQLDDERVIDQIELSCQDRDRRVREVAASLTAGRQRKSERRELELSLGLTVYKLLQEKKLELADSETVLSEISAIDARMDGGLAINIAMGLRSDRLAKLAQLVLAAFPAGCPGPPELETALRTYHDRELLLSPAPSAVRPTLESVLPAELAAALGAPPGGNGSSKPAQTPDAAPELPAADTGFGAVFDPPSTRDQGPAHRRRNGRRAPGTAKAAGEDFFDTAAFPTQGSPAQESITPYTLLLVPLILSTLIVGLVGYRIWNPPPRQPPAPHARRDLPKLTVDRAAAEAESGRFVGTEVRWFGRIAEVAADRRRLVVQTLTLPFSAHFPAAVEDSLDVSSFVRIDGIIVGVDSSGIVKLDGKAVAAAVRLGSQAPTQGAPE